MNFVGDHPLNLIGKVAIVTSASSAAGAAICRALLNSNAFVLGVDRDIAHHSTRSSRASQFQFLRTEEDDPFLGGKILKAVNSQFQKEHIDFLVNVVEDRMRTPGLGSLVGLLDAMAARGSGMVLNVSVGTEMEEDIVKSAKAACSQLKCEGIRCNVIVGHGVNEGLNAVPMLKETTKTALEEHIKEHDTLRQEGGYDAEKEREIASLTLFLCTSQGEAVKGAVIGIDGSCSPL